MLKTRIHSLRKLVDDMYGEHNPNRDAWADYLWNHHIYLVSNKAQQLCERFGGNQELVMAGAMLHDIGDAVTSRFDPRHEVECLRITQDFLTRAGFGDDEILIVNDILMHHSCRETLPQTQEGRIMATADAVVHLTSDFYEHALAMKIQEGESRESINNWALPKIERDFYVKIFFDEIRQDNQEFYKRAKSLFN